MCVIAISTKARPSVGMVNQMWNQNEDGGGAAWREGKGANKEVVWQKNLSRDDMQVMAETLPFPFILHFRIGSVGGVHPELTHPFPIAPDTGLELEGRTKGMVLFHNGHWNQWREQALRVAIETKTPLPVGRQWSDTRAMAYICSVLGIGYMDFIEEKGIAFGPHDYEIFHGRNGWVKIDDIWCSNDNFKHQSTKASLGRVCKYRTCSSFETDSTGYCQEHPNGIARFHKVYPETPPVVIGINTPFPKPVIGTTSPQTEVNGNKVDTGSGGSQNHIHPFRSGTEVSQYPPKIPPTPQPRLTNEQAEEMFKEGKLTRSALKRIRRINASVLKKMMKKSEKLANANLMPTDGHVH